MARGRKKGSKVEDGKVIQAINSSLPEGLGITVGVGKEGLRIEKEAEEGFALAKDLLKNNPSYDSTLSDPFKGVHWDVPLETQVEFFDPNLSYELTHYRPINETQGLDFNPSWFTEARDNKVRTGHYTSYRSGTKQHRDFWKEEFRRCIDGYESHGYRITGDNYFFLNYYRMKNVTDVSVTGKGRQTTFPLFFSKQYEYFHYIDMCAHLKKDVCALKARGVGWAL